MPLIYIRMAVAQLKYPLRTWSSLATLSRMESPTLDIEKGDKLVGAHNPIDGVSAKSAGDLDRRPLLP